MEETVFYVIGGALVVGAVVLSLIGLRAESFPGSRALLAGVVVLFAALVAATTTFAVLQAQEEQEAREAEEAEAPAEEVAGEAEAPAGEQGEAAPEETGQTAGGATTKLQLSAPEDGTLAFDPDKLAAKAGTVEIDFTNPAALQHDVVIASGSEVLAKSDLIADGASSTATAELEAGSYRFFCDVVGHEEAGMEGTLTVK